MIKDVLIGTTVILNAEFNNELGIRFAPTIVNIKYKKSDDSIVTNPVVPDINNKYTVNILMDTAGVWHFRWESTSGNTVAREFDITVNDTKIK